MAESEDVVDGRIERKCNICLNKGNTCIAEEFCSTCNNYLCADCLNNHNDFTVGHKMVGASKGPPELDIMKNQKVEMNGLDMCAKHNKLHEFYCKDEKRLICTTCAIVDHRKCDDVVEIANFAEDNRCDELGNELRTVISSTKEVVENLKEGMKTLSNDVQQIQEKLNKLKETFVKMFDDFAITVTDAAISYRNKMSTKWTTKQRECESQIADLNKMLDTIDGIVRHGTPSEQFIIERSMTDDIKQQSNDALTAHTDLNVLNVECNFEGYFKTFKTNLMSSLISDEFEVKYTVPKKTKLELITSIDLKQTGDDIGEPHYGGLDFLSDGRLVAVDNKNSKCLIFDENLHLKTSYKLPCNHPLDVVSVSNEEVTVTTGKRLDFLHISNTNTITLSRTCKVKALCSSISMKDDENFVVGCLDDNIPVRIVSMSGEEKTFVCKFPSKNYPLGTSLCTYIRLQDKLVMSDRDEDTIYIYDIKTGEKIVVKDKLIKKPCDVAVGPCDHVFVCSRDIHSIVEITSGGRVFSSHKLEMKSPGFLAMSNDGRRLAVTNVRTGDHKLTLYKTS